MGSPVAPERSVPIPLRRAPRRGRSVRLGAVSWIVAVTLLLGACAPAAPDLPAAPASPGVGDAPGAPASPGVGDAPGAPCVEVAAGYATQARDAFARFDEADAAAAAADEEDLRAAIDHLAAVRAEFSALEPSECARPVKVSIVRYMDLTTEIHNAVWADDCRLCIEDMRAQARSSRARALEDLASIEAQP